jgi:sterol 14-demethylase
VCESEAPAVFEVVEKGTVTVHQEHPDESERKGVELAVRYCPTHALSIEEVDAVDGGA